jgi:hypothetical protein
MTTPDPTQLAIDMATAQALPLVAATLPLTPEQRIEFVHTLLACMSGWAQQVIGHAAASEAFAQLAQQGPAASAVVH